MAPEQQPPTHSTVLVDEDGFMITHHEQTSGQRGDKLIVTFDNLNGKKRRVGFGTDFLASRGYETIHVAQKAGSFYQELDLETFARVLGPFARDRKMYTYGSSLGGYAAIYYAGCIDAQAIALSAQPVIYAQTRSLNRSYRKFETALKHPELGSGQVPKSKFLPITVHDPLLAYDEYIFREHILKLYGDAKAVLLENGMHSVAGSMLASGVLKDFILHAIETDQALAIAIDPWKDIRYATQVLKQASKAEAWDQAGRIFEQSRRLMPSHGWLKTLSQLVLAQRIKLPPDYTVPAEACRTVLKRLIKLDAAKQLPADFPSLQIEYYKTVLDFRMAHALAASYYDLTGDKAYLAEKSALASLLGLQAQDGPRQPASADAAALAADAAAAD